MKLRAKVEINGINPYVLVSSSIASTLKPNWRRAIPVIIQVNSKPTIPWHINMVPKGDGNYYLYLHERVRVASETKVGDTVDVDIQFDIDYKNGPQHEVPKALDLLLQTNTTMNKNWTRLPPSRQKEALRYLANVKSEEAKRRNIEKLITALKGNEIRFMGRDWKNGQ